MESKPQLMIATWPKNAGSYGYFGDCEYPSYDNNIMSAWLSLRNFNANDPDAYLYEEQRAVNDIGLYVWMSSEKSIHMKLALHGLSTLNVRECEMRLHALKKIVNATTKRYPMYGHFVKDSDIHTELTKIMIAMGISQCVVYGHGKPEFTPIGIGIKAIADILQSAIDRMPKPALEN